MRNLKRALSLTLASVMLLGMMVVGAGAAAGYDDVTDDNNVEAIEVLQAIEVMVGDDRGFGPDRPVNRAEMAVVMGKLLNLDYNYYSAACPFNDVYDWARGWVGACYANGIVSGRGDGVYDPGATVTAVEAASMLMRALGYFQYQNDYADGFVLATVKQGNKIGLFDNVGSSADAPMTRDQVAQIVLNALQAGMVEPDGNTTTFLNPDGSVLATTGKVNYVFVTSNKPFATAISGVRASSIGSTNDSPIVELGEQLYNGELKLYDNRSDEFARPARTWEYKGKEIGTYMKKELIRAEYTTAINGKTLYDLLGKAVIEDNYVFYYVDGREDPTVAAANMVRGNTKDYSTTGKGVLTQVFFDADREEITITSIDTFLAEVDDDYNEAKAELTVNIHANAPKGNDTKVTLDEVKGIEKYKEGDKVLVQVAWDGRAKYEIARVMDPTDMKDITLNKYSIRNYAVADGTQYDYAANGKDTMGALDELSSEGSYGDLQLADFTYNLWFDQYGYLIGNEQVEVSNRYVFITGYDFSGSHTAISHATASAIFTDGTMENITVDVSKTQEKIELYNHLANGGTTSNLNSTPKFDPKWYYDFDSANGNDARKSEYNMWFTYTTAEKNGGTVYTLTPVQNWVNQEYATDGKVNSYTLRTSATTPDLTKNDGSTLTSSVGLTDGKPNATGTHHWAVGDEDSVYLTVDTKDVTSGTARGISKVNGVFTGVQDVDIEVLSAANNKLNGVNRPNAAYIANSSNGYQIATDASVFAVADDNNYVIAAVVIGKDTASSKNYGYILGDAKDETYEKVGNYHYWSFEGVLNGKIETLTIRKTDVDEFKTLRTNIQGWMSNITTGTPDVHNAVNGFVEFEFDKDGYIIDAEQITNLTGSDNVYGEHDFGKDPDPDDFKTYLMPWGDNTNGAPNRTQVTGTAGSVIANFSTYSSQYTLHAGRNHPTEAGLTLAKDGTVVVVETEVYTGGEPSKVVWTQFSDVKKAIEYLEKSDENDPVNDRANDFTGWVAGPLNNKGTAQWLVLNTNQTKTVVTDGGASKNPGSDGEINIYVTFFTDKTAAASQIGSEETISKDLEADGSLLITKAEVEALLPGGYKLKGTEKFPKRLAVGEDSSFVLLEVNVEPPVEGQPSNEAGLKAILQKSDKYAERWEGVEKAVSTGLTQTISGTTVTVSGTLTPIAATDDSAGILTALKVFYYGKAAVDAGAGSEITSADAFKALYNLASTAKIAIYSVTIEGHSYLIPIHNGTTSTTRTVTGDVTGMTYTIDFSGFSWP